MPAPAAATLSGWSVSKHDTIPPVDGNRSVSDVLT
jgi:hypothetical protein